jgi:thiol-disulfide isomerase/thioredoxin
MAQERIRAPELEGGVGWLNTDTPLSLIGLRGKVVLLDFWTYCCINCMHIIPDLKKLEAKYPNQLVVIGVHSAKFPNEGESDNIRQAILRYEIEHPVVNDREFLIWRRYGPRSWPTLVLIDLDGYVVGGISGEGHYDKLDHVISQLVLDFRNRGRLDRRTPAARARKGAALLRQCCPFRGKSWLIRLRIDCLCRLESQSHSRNNEIWKSARRGRLGAIGAADGSFAAATFNHPQGMALDDAILYVADTENHLIRRVDLKSRTVTTIAGTGYKR